MSAMPFASYGPFKLDLSRFAEEVLEAQKTAKVGGGTTQNNQNTVTSLKPR